MMKWGKRLKKNGTAIDISGIYNDVFSTKTINFDSLAQNSFVYFGPYRCTPCRREMPSVVKLAADFPELNFIYISYDKSALITKEFTELPYANSKFSNNLFFIHLPYEYINDHNLATVYPSKYFIETKRIVKHFSVGGTSDENKDDKIYKILLKLIDKQG